MLDIPVARAMDRSRQGRWMALQKKGDTLKDTRRKKADNV